jgi:hypothetical protein
MFSALFFSRASVAGFLVGALLFPAMATPSYADITVSHSASRLNRPTFQSVNSQTFTEIDLQPSEQVLTHHGAEGTGASAILTGGTSSVSAPAISDSLWGNMILQMAYQRDAEIRLLAKKLGRVNSFLLISVLGVSGLSLAQNITTLATLNNDTEGGHHEDEEEHGHGGHHDSPAPAIMGIVGSGVTLAAVGTHAYLSRRYARQIIKRQDVINEQVSRLLNALSQGGDESQVKPGLAGLIGDRAAGEFLQLWHSAHPTVSH